MTRGHGDETEGLGGTICRSSLWHSLEQDIVIDGVDALTLQGWPSSCAMHAGFSDAEKKEMAGEGCHLGCFALFATAFYLNPYGQS